MSGHLRIWWKGLGWIKWPSALFIVVALVLSVVYEPVPLGWIEHGERAFGVHTLVLATKGRVQPGRDIGVRVVLGESEVPWSGRRRLEIVDGPGESFPVSLSPGEAFEATLRVPDEADRLVLRVTADGPPSAVAQWDLGGPL